MTEKTKLNLHEIENMIIWERDVYVSLMNIETENKQEAIKERILTS
jgi:hypothetical protein|tara:strand:+ start:420 stop:557 length:138 start_codon:yes stop_codon:yes gene_type:complete